MCRSALVLVSLTLASLVALAPGHAAAGTPIAGTTSCDATGRFEFGPYLPLVPSPSGRTVRVKGKLRSSTCDGTDVTGGRAPLRIANVTLRGIMPAGTDCASLLDSVAFAKSTVTVKWQGLNDAGNFASLGASKATIASASFDSGSERFRIVTAPIAKGAFAGSTVSIAFPLGDVTEYTRICNLVLENGGGFSSFNWGAPMNSHTVSVTVP